MAAASVHPITAASDGSKTSAWLVDHNSDSNHNEVLNNNYYSHIANYIISNDTTTVPTKEKQYKDGEGHIVRSNSTRYVNPHLCLEAKKRIATKLTEGKYVLKMHNITGMLVYSSDMMVAKGSNSFNIKVGIYNGGKYFIQLIAPSGETLTTPIEKI